MRPARLERADARGGESVGVIRWGLPSFALEPAELNVLMKEEQMPERNTKRKKQFLGFMGVAGVRTGKLKNLHQAIVTASTLFEIDRDDVDAMAAKIQAMGKFERQARASRNLDKLAPELISKATTTPYRPSLPRENGAAARAPTWLRSGAAALFLPGERREYEKQRMGTFGPASAVRRIDPETGEVIE